MSTQYSEPTDTQVHQAIRLAAEKVREANADDHETFVALVDELLDTIFDDPN